MVAVQCVLTMGSTTLDLSPQNTWKNGIALASKDFGAPTVREVTYDKSSMDGTDDQTHYYSQRVVNFTGKCFSQPNLSRSAAWRKIEPFLDPNARITITFAGDVDDPVVRQITNARISQWSRTPSSPVGYDIQLQWKADPAAIDQNQQSVDISSGASSTLGRTYPRTYNLAYPTQPGGSGLGTAHSKGTFKTWPIYRIYGPTTNPTIALLVGGVVVGQVRLILGISSGTYVEINSAARTVMLGGSTGSSRYSNLDSPNTTWVPMAPGTNTFRYTAQSLGAASHCTILWNDAFLT